MHADIPFTVQAVTAIESRKFTKSMLKRVRSENRKTLLDAGTGAITLWGGVSVR